MDKEERGGTDYWALVEDEVLVEDYKEKRKDGGRLYVGEEEVLVEGCKGEKWMYWWLGIRGDSGGRLSLVEEAVEAGYQWKKKYWWKNA